MKTALVTGAGGLVGSETARHFAGQGYRVVGVDNNPRPLEVARQREAVPPASVSRVMEKLGVTTSGVQAAEDAAHDAALGARAGTIAAGDYLNQRVAANFKGY